MTFRLRRGMVAEDGPGWAVVDGNGDPLPGRWADQKTAHEQGLLGVYLLSGIDVVEIEEQPMPDSRGGYTYRGWTFYQVLSATVQYAIHGPNSTGRRARKIVSSKQAAIDYIDRTVG